MALTSVGSLGTAQEKTSDTSISLPVTANAEAGNIVAVWVAMDNVGTADANTTQITVTDDQSNEYVRVRERTESAGAANDGVVLGLFVSVLTTQLNSGENIIATSASAVTAKAISAWEFTTGSTGIQIQATNAANGASGDPVAISLSSLTSREYLLLWGFASEDVVNISTHDADYTAIDDIGTSGSTADTNVTVDGAFRIATLTSDTVDATASAGSQHVQVYAAIYEITVQNRTTQQATEVVVAPTTAAGRTTQEAIEAVVLPTTAAGRVTQEAVEVVAEEGNPIGRVTQQYTETVLGNEPVGRVTQEYIEVAVNDTVAGRTTQQYIEAAVSDDTAGRVTQQYAEIVLGNERVAHITQQYIEVAYSYGRPKFIPRVWAWF